MGHPLHGIIGECINTDEFPDCKIIKDPACGGHQNIPLFCSEVKSNETEYCNVDLLIIKDDKIRVIIEIEESDVKPTQICGKFLTSALSSYYIHGSEENKPIEMDDSVLFIQVLDTSRLKEKTSKIKQWKNLERSINSILPVNNIRKYKIVHGSPSNFKNRNSSEFIELMGHIKEALK